jgi:AcrR family transcriptional regulator
MPPRRTHVPDVRDQIPLEFLMPRDGLEGKAGEADARVKDKDRSKAARKERRLQATRDEIREAAWAHVAEHGAYALSLRAVAASIGLSAPALYRYFPSKNHLVTALIVEAFESLAEAQDAALRVRPAASWQDRLRELGLAYRAWALARPAAFYLIFGDPVPGYEAPWEETMPAAGRSLGALITVFSEARAASGLRLPLEPPASPTLQASLRAWSDSVHHTDPEILYLSFVTASRVQGLMLVELGRQLPPFFADGAELYGRELERIIAELRP